MLSNIVIFKFPLKKSQVRKQGTFMVESDPGLMSLSRVASLWTLFQSYHPKCWACLLSLRRHLSEAQEQCQSVRGAFGWPDPVLSSLLVQLDISLCSKSQPRSTFVGLLTTKPYNFQTYNEHINCVRVLRISHGHTHEYVLVFSSPFACVFLLAHLE